MGDMEIEVVEAFLIHWGREETLLLLELYQGNYEKVGRTSTLKTKSKLWDFISQKLCEKGFFYTATQVQQRYYTLEKSYKNTKKHNNKTGRNKRTCKYEDELAKILENRPIIQPEVLLERSTHTNCTQVANDLITEEDQVETEKQDEQGNESYEEDNPPVPATTSDTSEVNPTITNTAKKEIQTRKRVRKGITKRLEELFEQRRDFHINYVEEMRKRNNLMERRNELLSKLIDSIQQADS